MPKQHYLDIYPQYFAPVVEGLKTFEIRRNEGFEVGDALVLREYDPETSEYSGHYVEKTVVYITNYAQKENYVVLGIE